MATFDMQRALLLEADEALLRNQTGLNTIVDPCNAFLESVLSGICYRTLLALMQNFSFLLVSAFTGRHSRASPQPCNGDDALVFTKMEAAALKLRTPFLASAEQDNQSKDFQEEETDLSERCRADCSEPIQSPEIVHRVPWKQIAGWILVAKNKDDDDDADEDDEDDEDDNEDDLEDEDEAEGGDDEEAGGEEDEDGDEGDADEDGEDEDDEFNDEDEDEDEEEDEDEDESPPKKKKK